MSRRTTQTNKAPTRMESTVSLSLDALRESPFNPRRTFNEAALRELADTMKPPHGAVLQPIVVRPLEQTDIRHTHEVVFGHRRCRAARLAGLETIPAIVRSMSDEEVKRAQIVENLQREDVNAVEEADGYKALRVEHGTSIETLMEQTGKSRSYIFNRLKLATAHDAVREAVQSGSIGPEIAQEIARVPNALQPKALSDVTYREQNEGKEVVVAYSFRRARSILAERYQLKLAAAPFDTLSVTLVPDVVACDACPKRSDAEPTLALEIGPGVCTDPDCFATKKAAAVALQVEAMRQAGRTVLVGGEAEEAMPFGVVSMKKARHLDDTAFWEPCTESRSGSRSVTWREAMERAGEQAPKSFAIVSPRDGQIVEVISVEDATALRWFLSEDDASQDNMNDRDAHLRIDDRPAEVRAVDSWEGWHAVKAAIMAKVMASSVRTADELRLVAAAFVHMAEEVPPVIAELFGWEDALVDVDTADLEPMFQEKLAELSPDELGKLVVMLALDLAPFALNRGRSIREKLMLAHAYRVNVLDLMRQPAAEAPAVLERPTAARRKQATATTIDPVLPVPDGRVLSNIVFPSARLAEDEAKACSDAAEAARAA